MLSNDSLINEIATVTEKITVAIKNGNRPIFAGNGGSAADAQHLAAEFVNRFQLEGPGMPALSLSKDTSILTSIGNDYGYEQLFLRQLRTQSRPGDKFIGVTTSGKSKNIMLALDACNELQVTSVALCGMAGLLNDNVEHILRVPSIHAPRIQECHILIVHIICEEVEKKLFGKNEDLLK